MPEEPLRIAIVDYGMGNLYSVQQACAHVGMDATITSTPADLEAADGMILPGVGAFGDAMDTLRSLGLARTMCDLVGSGRPLVGICLGQQLLMDVSFEFGEHEGLGLVAGEVVHLGIPREGDRPLKVPQVGWNSIQETERGWTGTPLAAVPDGTPMYFVHSYVVSPSEDSAVLALTDYGDVEFCSALLSDNVFACQFHPERSAEVGLRIYENMVGFIRRHASMEE